MELFAIYLSLRSIFEEPEAFAPTVTIHSESPYIRRGVQDWMDRWAARQWKKADYNDVVNADLWRLVFDYINGPLGRKVVWSWDRQTEGYQLGIQYALGLSKNKRRITIHKMSPSPTK